MLCTHCYADTVPPPRATLGYTTCLPCGEEQAKRVKHTVLPMHKSNYVLCTDRTLLTQLNPKRTS